MAVGVISCGSSSSSAPSTAETGSSSAKEKRAGDGERSSKESSGGESKPAEAGDPRSFGEEAGSGEREAASQALEAFMEARAAGEWDVECSYAGREAIQPIEEFFSNSRLKGKSCSVLLANLAKAQSKEARKNNLAGAIEALRIEGAKAFAIYRGTGGGVYAMPMALEDGDWKIGSVVALKLPAKE